jgi:hypothetical protein
MNFETFGGSSNALVSIASAIVQSKRGCVMREIKIDFLNHRIHSPNTNL